MHLTKSSITLLAALLAFITVAGCAGLAYFSVDLCPECHLSLSDLSGMYERDNKDSCLHAFTGNVSMLPSFDEVLAEIEADIAADSEGCLTHGTSSPSLITGVCSEGGYRYISRVSNQFAASTLYFDPTTEQLVGITSYGDFGLCGPNTYYISRIECDEMTNQVAICP